MSPVPTGRGEALRALPAEQLRVEIRTGDVANVVTVQTGADRQTLRLDGAPRRRVTAVRAEAGLPYSAHLDQPTSYVYAVSITSATGFTPLFTRPARATSASWVARPHRSMYD